MARDKAIIKKHGKIADEIIALDSQMTSLTDEQLKAKTEEFKSRIQAGESLDDLLVEVYAVVREAAFRVLGMKAYRVQIIGSIILHTGDIAEMKTGEGKTLTGLFPAYLNALSGEGVHIVTVNEYLSQRDSEINGQVYNFLGLTVGLNGRDLTKDQKRNAYAQDVTYTTNAELGFDYLRDNMVFSFAQKVQRGLNYAIIDEADSVLIDEARTPLIISGGSQNRVNLYMAADSFAKSINNKEEVDIDLETKQVYLNDKGMEAAQKFFSINNLFDTRNTELFHLIMNALKANFIFKKDVEYAVQDNEIVLIDQFTGRVMPGRAYSDGLQQAIQAKEGVEVEEETATLATITYQNFYRLYNKLSGMTGTAKTEEEEFLKIYNTRVVVTPTNRPIIRNDEPDMTFGTKNAALKRVVADIKEINAAGRPVLIGTTSVESSEQVSHYLDKANLKYEMINAKNHHREAEIVEKAGLPGAITLATNMAGRGTDIKLTEDTRKAGGLFVIGVERNEARRIDNQLRGRAGRQGDPGSSRFYISMEDELMVRFTKPKIRMAFMKLGDDYIKSKMFTRAITNAQKKLEGLNFDQRKNVLDYDNVLSQHREAMYAQRDDILTQPNLKLVIEKFQYTTAYELLQNNSELVYGEKNINVDTLLKDIDGVYVPKGMFKKENFLGKETNEVARMIQEGMMKFYLAKITDVPEDVMHKMELKTILKNFDKYWTRHINLAQKLRSGIYLQQYAQNNPLHEYVEESAKLFNTMKIDIAKDTIDELSSAIFKEVNDGDLESIQNVSNKKVEITDKDIDQIFEEIGLTKKEFSRKNVEKKFKELYSKHKKDEDKILRLQFQEQVLNGLMDELDKKLGLGKYAEPRRQLTEEELKLILKRFDFENKVFTEKDVQEKFEELSKNMSTEERKNLIIEAQVLTALAQGLEQLSKQQKEKEFVMTDKDGKVKKRYSKKGDDEVDELEDTEKVQSQTKIG